MKEIRIVIDKNGRISIDFDGFIGKQCFKEREKLQELLKKYGIDVSIEYEEKKPEAYIEEEQHVQESLW